jgi:hypothetical protein
VSNLVQTSIKWRTREQYTLHENFRFPGRVKKHIGKWDVDRYFTLHLKGTVPLFIIKIYYFHFLLSIGRAYSYYLIFNLFQNICKFACKPQTNQQKCSFIQIHISNWLLTTKQSKKNQFILNIKTFSDMLRMQDFALNISKFSFGGMSR